MKRLLLIGAAIVLLPIGCKELADSGITGAVSFGTTEGLQYAIQDTDRRTKIADYICVYAPALRSITGNPTPEELLTQINRFVPASVTDNLPEIKSVVIPLIISFTKKFGSTGKVMNDIAAGLEQGATPFATKK